MNTRHGLFLGALLCLPACGEPPRDTGATGSTGLTVGTDSGGTSTSAGDTGDLKYDAGDGNASATAGDGEPVCKVVDGYDGKPSNCEDQAPPDSFAPEVQWSFTPPDGAKMSVVIPLVANLTDDNGDGEIDLCDIPDVILTATPDVVNEAANLPDLAPSYIYVLDGATGTLHYKIEHEIGKFAQPAVGDVDGDGIVEIIAVVDDEVNKFAIFEHDGSLKLLSDSAAKFMFSDAAALYDLDADGDVEIIFGEQVFDHEGKLLWYGVEGVHHEFSATTAADLDGDGKLEVVVGQSAFRHDGSLYYLNLDIGDGGSSWASGYPQVANFDEDDDPEVLVANEKGVSLLDHEGNAIYQKLTPTGDAAVGLNWARPAAVHDFDGDGTSEYAMGSAEHFSVFEGDATVTWTAVVEDLSGSAASTAFDFLGDGGAEAMYADERDFRAYNGKTGELLVMEPRLSRTAVEYPVVADIDNDGSAEVLVVSNESWEGEHDGAPTLKAIRDAEDRWIPARRIWNQHAYHVTNVREDGTIPQVPAKHWLELNTFRTQAQIGGGGVCKPKPQG